MNNFTCLCGSQYFDAWMTVHDREKYSMSIDMNGETDLDDLLDSEIGDSELDDTMVCQRCKRVYRLKTGAPPVLIEQ